MFNFYLLLLLHRYSVIKHRCRWNLPHLPDCYMITAVIPTLNAERTLVDCLESIKNQKTPVDNIIVVDGGSTDNTLQIAAKFADRVITTSANRSSQRNLGWKSSDSSAIIFIDADMILDPFVITECEKALTYNPSLAGLVIPEQSYGESFWSKVKWFERSFYQGIWWMEAARCFRRDILVSTGGYDPALIGGEDWDIDERARAQGAIAHIQSFIWHNEQTLDLRIVRTKKSHYATTLQAYIAKHPIRALRQLSLQNRISLFLRNPRRLMAHPILTAGLFIIGCVEWLSMHRMPTHTNLEKPMP